MRRCLFVSARGNVGRAIRTAECATQPSKEIS